MLRSAWIQILHQCISCKESPFSRVSQLEMTRSSWLHTVFSRQHALMIQWKQQKNRIDISMAISREKLHKSDMIRYSSCCLTGHQHVHDKSFQRSSSWKFKRSDGQNGQLDSAPPIQDENRGKPTQCYFRGTWHCYVHSIPSDVNWPLIRNWNLFLSQHPWTFLKMTSPTLH